MFCINFYATYQHTTQFERMQAAFDWIKAVNTVE